MAHCGAKTRNGDPCAAQAMKNGRCRMHGGTATKTHAGNLNNLKHGFYSDALLPEELPLYQRATVGSLDDEIRLAKVKLHRFVRLSGNTDLEELIDGAVSVVKKRGAHPKFGEFDETEIKAAAPNYSDLILKQIDLIRKLELARAELENAGLAARLKQAELQEINGKNGGGGPVTSIAIRVVGNGS
ncbi:HGGxSTG domain-containing protein [Chitinimonas naiadis]